MAAPFEFLYPIIHEFKKAECVPTEWIDVQVIDLKERVLLWGVHGPGVNWVEVLPNGSSDAH
ncbi:hypothetical protein [Pseudomonas sp. PICF6]|uniref:hypothetical protein n=1 Tax=Pseudomonas sp. PICF6 TaxID=2664172 RepID=UPI00136F6CB5|nr:hypothetical protein [Pseudomonas sp. PICF6]MXR29848.1 hypothetical protein [Pseudomonas sp. PICF6]